jgi:hypothetical protein
VDGNRRDVRIGKGFLIRFNGYGWLSGILHEQSLQACQENNGIPYLTLLFL